MSKHQFQTEVSQLLHLMIHSLYSHKEIFLRELVSNASDAIDKLNYLTLTDESYKSLTFSPKIEIKVNKELKTLTIKDNGIGMNEEELIEHLGTIAKSGTKSFLSNLTGDAKKDSQLIGQFGVGFYSAFMVASQIEVVSRKANEEEAYKWSSDASGEFEITKTTKEQFGSEAKIVFVDDGDVLNELLGCDILNFEQFLNLEGQKKVTIAIANSKIREKLTMKCLENGIEIFDLKASNVVVLEDVKMDDGSILCPFVTLTSDITIGKSFQANIYSYVAHDCVIGDYVTFAPAVKCNGNVHIDDHAYIGTGAIIKQGKPDKPLRIGKGAVIGAGAVVTKNVPDGITVFGNPAIELTKENIKRRS